MRLLVVLVCLAFAAPAAAGDLFKGWWVVVAAYPLDPPARQSADAQRVEAAARRCGARTFNDESAKFRGFRPGVNVFVIGAFASRDLADAKARAVQPCFPGAYVKFGEHLGE